MDIFFFLLFAFLALACALNVVLQTHPISSAISLVGVMSSLAVLYLLLGAEFLAMAQVIVYAGAVMVLFIFVIMLLNAGSESRAGSSTTAQWFGIPGLLAFFGALAFFVTRQYPRAATVKFGDFAGGGVREIGNLLFTSYLLPFEVTSVLILIGVIGAIVLARKELD